MLEVPSLYCPSRSVRAIHNLYEGMAMTTMTDSRPLVVGGVDTHKDQHVAAVVDMIGRILGTASFPNDAKGYRQLRAWMARHGEIDRVGIEDCLLRCRPLATLDEGWDRGTRGMPSRSATSTDERQVRHRRC